MSQKIKTAVLGLNAAGWQFLNSICDIEDYELVAVGDADMDVAQAAATQFKCAPYDDYRQLVTQNKLDCLIVCAGLHNCEEYLKTAIRKKIHIIKKPPIARHFEEAVELETLAKLNGVKFAVANTLRYSQSMVAMSDMIDGGPASDVLWASVDCVSREQQPAWQMDPQLAGGGALINTGYEFIDCLVRFFELPQQVYCLNNNAAVDRKQRQSITEDFSLLNMKFSDSLIANMSVSRLSPVSSNNWTFGVESRQRHAHAGENTFKIQANDGTGERISMFADSEVVQYKKFLEDFYLDLQNIETEPDNEKPRLSTRSDILTMAVIEAAYLSSRTGAPEDPAKILQLARIAESQPKLF